MFYFPIPKLLTPTQIGLFGALCCVLFQSFFSCDCYCINYVYFAEIAALAVGLHLISVAAALVATCDVVDILTLSMLSIKQSPVPTSSGIGSALVEICRQMVPSQPLAGRCNNYTEIAEDHPGASWCTMDERRWCGITLMIVAMMDETWLVTVHNSSFTDCYLQRIVLANHHRFLPYPVSLFMLDFFSVEFCCPTWATIG